MYSFSLLAFKNSISFWYEFSFSLLILTSRIEAIQRLFLGQTSKFWTRSDDKDSTWSGNLSLTTGLEDESLPQGHRGLLVWEKRVQITNLMSTGMQNLINHTIWTFIVWFSSDSLILMTNLNFDAHRVRRFLVKFFLLVYCYLFFYFYNSCVFTKHPLKVRIVTSTWSLSFHFHNLLKVNI